MGTNNNPLGVAMTARDEAIEVVARAFRFATGITGDDLRDNWDDVPEDTRVSWRRRAAVALDAFLQATEPCTTCGGRGHATNAPPRSMLHSDDPADYPCPACDGTGTQSLLARLMDETSPARQQVEDTSYRCY